ncbi:leucyl/phenylalanyl-tRNA--protein transferase [Celerinatantimonas yamalensis]|uniref:Leucyl/phenylalanyl-tRNA--protein transferase n=1 Tax=Celerinatantimonas yamalensis TaxID=559956 RepID=A0ABW9G2W6_9GAMM
MQLHVLADNYWFPDIEQALDDPDGLLAMGGDLSCQRLVSAYRHGIFPWYNDSQPLLWWSPKIRAVISPEHVHISRSMKKWMAKCPYRITLNSQFERIIAQCAIRPHDGTWITKQMQQAYIELHHQGFAHSVEVWDDDKLVGGLYGVSVGQLFCGESMFHRATNASKLAFIQFSHHFAQHGGQLIDAQMPTTHLQSLGVVDCPRRQFKHYLRQYRDQAVDVNCWESQEL